MLSAGHMKVSMTERIRRSRSSARLALVVSPLALAACGRASASTNEPPKDQDVVHVETVQAVTKSMPRVIRLTGSVVGLRQTDLAANTSGRVVDTPVDRGSEVKKGDVLARLDVRSAALNAEEAQASLAALDARQRYDADECARSNALFQDGAISKAEYERSKLQCDISPADRKASLAHASLAALSVTDGVVRAPFAGYVTERRVHEGEYVRADSPIVSLVDLDALRLEVAVPEVYLSSLRPGVELRFAVPAFDGREFTAKLRATSGAVRPATRDVLADGEIANKDHALLPGMFASVLVELAPADAVAVPEAAILAKNGGFHVFALVGDRLEERVVDLGGKADGFVAIERGLHAGDAVVRAASADIRNGQSVR
jgi:membrane fusion protein (multidrug efflux system)